MIKTTAQEIHNLLRKKFDDRFRWLHAAEVGDANGWRHLDHIVVNCWDSDGHAIDGYEIKISRSDLKRELTDPEKHAVFFPHLDTFSLVAPHDICRKEELPDKWGFLGVFENADGKYLKWVRKPNALHDAMRDQINRSFAFRLLRKISEASDAVAAMREQLQKKYEEGLEEGKSIRQGRDPYWAMVNRNEAEELKICKAFLEALGLGWDAKDTIANAAAWLKALNDKSWAESDMVRSLSSITENAAAIKGHLESVIQLRNLAEDFKKEISEKVRKETEEAGKKEVEMPVEPSTAHAPDATGIGPFDFVPQ